MALRLHPLAPAEVVTWSTAMEAFLRRRELAVTTQRVYRLTLTRVGQELGDPPLRAVTSTTVSTALHASYPACSPAGWNRHVATLRSFTSFAARSGWMDANAVATLARRRVVEDHNRALTAAELERLWARRDLSVRDRALFRLLYETAARAEEVLRLNVEDIDLAQRRAVTTRKGGAVDTLHFQTGAARLLPRIMAGRGAGPLFLTERRPAATRAPALLDLDSATGRARLSYRRAAQVF
ncbi:MAG: tyrosine-type recombinase/integrase [Actinomycetota bacterium]|nr:tyrosine-type recombinase/integrase [Actinomycetota bacterium]